MTVNKTFLVRGSGVDTNKYVYSEEPKGPIKVVFPARLLKDKGIREFIEAIRILKVRPGFKAEFLLCGDLDPLNPTSVSRNEVESWTRENLVQWVGFSDDMPNTYRNCHLVVLPSYREGLPLALIEAASAGRAIVTTDVPGCREIVVHGYNGYLAKLQDPHSLAEYIEMLISNPLMRNEMGKNGRKLVEEHFAMEIVHRQMLSIYLEVSKN
jgi:glycosyltransferase involved in cell wall biosynthesis